MDVTESPVARNEHDRLLVDRSAKPVGAYVSLCERGERRYVLDADDGARSATSTTFFFLLLLLLLLRVANEVAEHACEIARSDTDVEYARATAAGGTVA